MSHAANPIHDWQQAMCILTKTNGWLSVPLRVPCKANVQSSFDHAYMESSYEHAYMQTSYGFANVESSYGHAHLQSSYDNANVQSSYDHGYVQSSYVGNHEEVQHQHLPYPSHQKPL